MLLSYMYLHYADNTTACTYSWTNPLVHSIATYFMTFDASHWYIIANLRRCVRRGCVLDELLYTVGWSWDVIRQTRRNNVSHRRLTIYNSCSSCTSFEIHSSTISKDGLWHSNWKGIATCVVYIVLQLHVLLYVQAIYLWMDIGLSSPIYIAVIVIIIGKLLATGWVLMNIGYSLVMKGSHRQTN